MTLRGVVEVLTRVNEADQRRAVHLVREARRLKKTVFFVGNGGSAAIASHMAADFLKAGGCRSMCFTDGALVTCLANDEGYRHVFSIPLAAYAQQGDLLVAISSSGKSENILNAASVAAAMNMDIITLSGFAADNMLRNFGNVNFWVDSDRYGVVEVAHHAICHSILDAVVNDA